MKKITALIIETRGVEDQAPFYFQPLMIGEIMQELNVVYDEVFVWPVESYLAIWVVGDQVTSLAHAFLNYRHLYEKLQLLEDKNAYQLFRRISEGKLWPEVSCVKKLDTLQYAYELNDQMNCVGPTLFPFIVGTISFLRNYAAVYGGTNSWSYERERGDKKASIVSVKSREAFYRFCVN